MPTRHPAQAAGNSRCLSARQWLDVRQAARIARSEGVSLVLHGVKVGGDNVRFGNSKSTTPPHQEQDKSGGPEPMVTSEPTVQQESKKQPSARSVRRREEFRARKRAEERWMALTQKSLWVARRKRRDDTWTAWMRSTFSPRRDARRKIRAAFWGAWSKRQFKLDDERANGPLGMCSLRDMYIYKKAMVMEKKLMQLGFIAQLPLETITEEDAGPQAEAPAVTNPGIAQDVPLDAGRQASTRSLTEARIPSTPSSARARKKRSGGRRG